MNILIVGGSGLLGQKMSELVSNRKLTVYSTYHSNPSRKGIPIQLDICDEKSVEKVIAEAQPQVILHTAALTDVDKCEVEKDLALNINFKGTQNLIKTSKKYDPHFIFMSTDYVFSGEKGLYRENDDQNPVNYYGYTKYLGEKDLIRSELKWTIIRTCVLYGLRSTDKKYNFANWIISELKHKRKIKIITDQTISPTLNSNLSNMIMEIMDEGLEGIYHCSGATALSRYGFASLIADYFNLEKELIDPITLKDMSWIAKRPINSSLNVEKAIKKLENKPLAIDQALKQLKTEYEKND